MSDTPETFDFIIVGLGPAGLTSAAFLARQGYRVAGVERHHAPYPLPRAGHVDHEIVRYLQDLGVVDQFLPDAYPSRSYKWLNQKGDVLLNVHSGNDAPSGRDWNYMMFQPVLEDALTQAISNAPAQPVFLRGYALTQLEQNDDEVIAQIQPCGPDGEVLADQPAKSIRARYLLAGDGARSSIRNALGIPMNDLQFSERWLIVDVRLKRPLADVEPFQICDPQRPIYCGPLGRRHHRWEFAIRPDEETAPFNTPEMAWELLGTQGIGPDDVEILRNVVYTFEAKVAEEWRKGCVFLLGDAAHTMPPFMGQGACSAIRDAANITWKLDLVNRGVAGRSILDSYQVEREPHTRHWIQLSVMLGEYSCTFDEKVAAERDAVLLSGKAPPMPPLPTLTGGVLDIGDEGDMHPLVGKLFPQRPATLNGAEALLDDLTGPGFLLISFQETDKLLTPETADLQARMGVRSVTLSTEAGSDQVVDHTGFYRQWLKDNGASAVLVRPDHWIFGVAQEPADIDALITRLAKALDVSKAVEPVNA